MIKKRKRKYVRKIKRNKKRYNEYEQILRRIERWGDIL